MKKFLLLALCASMSAFGTSLMTGDNQGTGSTSNPRVWNLGGGLTMTVRGFELISGSFVAANTTHFGETNIGLGVCGVYNPSGPVNQTEDCSFHQWQVDNAPPGGRDFILFTFNNPVNLTNFTVAQTSIEADSDWAWAISTSALTTAAQLNSLTLTNVNGAVLDPGESSTRTIASAVGVRSILIGTGTVASNCSASNLGNCDLFKFTDINVANPIPEPSSMAMLGGGLIGLSVVARKRRKKS